MSATKALDVNPFLSLTDGERSLIAKGLAKFLADDHDFNVLMPAAGKYVQAMDTTRKCPEFYKSVASAWRRYGRLTDKQVIAVMHGVKRCPLLAEALTDPEEEFQVTYPAPVAVKPELKNVPTGFYTLGDEEGHITLRVKQWTPPGEDKSKTIIAALVGPHNVTDYQAFADIRNGEIAVWSRFRNGYERWKAAANALFTGDVEKFGLTFALTSNSCRRCGALLTHPASIENQYGPECIKHVGG